jgi:glycosyltransferase involved in cell wall biosynthesis
MKESNHIVAGSAAVSGLHQEGLVGLALLSEASSRDSSQVSPMSPQQAGEMPRVSIGLPVYNGADFLRQAVDSILQQDFTDFELIICDNASTDETAAICEQYAAADPRVRYFRNATNIGAGPNYRRVFELARGGLFKWAAHDDVHLPGFLTRCVEVLEHAPPSVVLVAPRAEAVDENGRKIRQDWQPETLDTRDPQPYQRAGYVLRNVAWATAQFGLYRTEQLRQTRLIDGFFASDQVLLLELSVLGEIWEIPDVLFQRRLHPGVSHLINKSHAEFTEWFDPSRKARRRLWPRLRLDMAPRWKLGWEFTRSIARMPMSPKERMLCFATVWWVWSARESRRLGKDYWNRAKRGFRKLFGAQGTS